MDKDYILKKGSLLFRVQRSGMYQKLNFTVKYEEVPGGKIPYLCTDKIVESPELLRMAQETGLPVSAKNGKFFPAGKTSLDFLISDGSA